MIPIECHPVMTKRRPALHSALAGLAAIVVAMLLASPASAAPPSLARVERTDDGYVLIGNGFGTSRSKVQVFEGKTPVPAGAIVSLTDTRIVVRSKTAGDVEHLVIVGGVATAVVKVSQSKGPMTSGAKVMPSDRAVRPEAIAPGSLPAGTTATAPSGGTSSTTAAPGPTVTVLAPTSQVLVAQAGTAEVRLSAAAPSGGTVVALSSSDPSALVVPGSVTVPAGATSATFSVASSGYEVTASNLTLTAVAGGVSRTASYSVMAGSGVAALDLPAIMAGGSTATGTVRLRAAPPSGSVTVRLRAIVGNSISTQLVPASVTIGAGQTSATFAITAPAVSGNQSVNICATAASECPTSDGRSFTRTFMVGSPPGVTQMLVRGDTSPTYLETTTVLAGRPVALAVVISMAATAGGTPVAVTSSRPDIVPAPATITVPAGETNNIFAQTGPVIALTRAVTAPTTVTFTATGGGQTKTATLTVQPGPQVSAVSVTPASAAGAGVVTGTVTLAQTAPTGGVEVALSSTSTAAVVPAKVTVAAGQTIATFSIATQAVPAATNATIGAAFAGATRTTVLALTP